MKYLIIAVFILVLAACKKSDPVLVDTPDYEDTADYINYRLDGTLYKSTSENVQVTKAPGDLNYTYAITGELKISASSPIEYRKLEIIVQGNSTSQIPLGGITNFSTPPNFASYSYFKEPSFLIKTDSCAAFGLIVTRVTPFVKNSIAYYTALGTFSGVLKTGSSGYNISNGRFRVTYAKP